MNIQIEVSVVTLKSDTQSIEGLGRTPRMRDFP